MDEDDRWSFVDMGIAKVGEGMVALRAQAWMISRLILVDVVLSFVKEM